MVKKGKIFVIIKRSFRYGNRKKQCNVNNLSTKLAMSKSQCYFTFNAVQYSI